MRVGCYIRVSTQEQAKEGYSIPAQTERLKSYCMAREWDVFGIYSDPGYSGAKTERPALQKLISDIQKGVLDLVLVYKLDRLSRSQKDTLYLIEDVFLKNGVDFVSINENFDTSTAFGRAMIGILSVFAQLEREQIKERTQMGRSERAKQGLWHGGGASPIGYDYNETTGQLEINEYEALQVREVFDMFLQKNYAFSKILSIIREKGYKHKHGQWSSGKNLRYLLSNPIYIGKISWEGNEYPGQHESIIPEELFAETQRRLRERTWRMGTPSYTPFSSTQLLSGMLFCSHCGGRYYGSGAYRGSKKLPNSERDYVHIYTCYSRSKTKLEMIKNPNCKNKNWRAEILDAYIIESIRRLEYEKGYFEQVTSQVKENPENKQKLLIEKKLSALDMQISKILDLYQFQNVPASQIAERLDSITKEKNLLMQTLSQHSLNGPCLPIDKAKEILQGATKILHEADMEEKRNLLQMLIRGINIDNDTIIISWTFA